MGRKVLLIDDSAMLRRIATSILHSQPGRYDVITATRATEGFALACIGGVDLILLDYRLAGQDEAQLCRRLHADARTSRVPMVLMFGQGSRPPAMGSLPTNVVDLLAKPFAPEQLSGVVNTVFSFSRAGSSLRDLRATLHPELVDAEALPAAVTNLNGHENPVSIDEVSAQFRPASAVESRLPAEAAPDEGEVVLKGTTAITSLNSVMHAVESGGYSGVLRLWPESGMPTEVIFDQGHLVVVTTRDAETYATRATDVLPTKISPATLEEALEAQKESGVPFLLNLGVRGLLSKSAAVALLHRFGEWQFARLWPQKSRAPLRFEFRSLPSLPQYVLRLEPSPLALHHWLLETTRKVRAEDIAANLRHEGTVGTPWFQTDGEAIVKTLDLAEDERAFLRLANGRTDLPGLARALGTTQEAVYLMLFRFRCLDVLSYRTAPAAFVVTPRTNLRRVLPLKR